MALCGGTTSTKMGMGSHRTVMLRSFLIKYVEKYKEISIPFNKEILKSLFYFLQERYDDRIPSKRNEWKNRLNIYCLRIHIRLYLGGGNQ